MAETDSNELTVEIQGSTIVSGLPVYFQPAIDRVTAQKVTSLMKSMLNHTMMI